MIYMQSLIILVASMVDITQPTEKVSMVNGTISMTLEFPMPEAESNHHLLTYYSIEEENYQRNKLLKAPRLTVVKMVVKKLRMILATFMNLIEYQFMI